MRSAVALAIMAMVAITAPAAAKARPSAPQSSERCRDRADGDPDALQQCSSRDIAAAMKRVPRARANASLKALFPDMFDTLMQRMTGEDDTLSGRVVIVAAYAELAERRAAILTGRARIGAARPAKGALFAGVPGGGGFAKRWAAIRDSDCRDYPVTRCAERLDDAMREMLDSLKPE